MYPRVSEEEGSPWFNVHENRQNAYYSCFYFLLINYRKAQGLKFGGEEEGCGLALTMFLLRGPS